MDDGSIDGAMSEGAHQGAPADICKETTIPNQGQNLWLEHCFCLRFNFILFFSFTKQSFILIFCLLNTGSFVTTRLSWRSWWRVFTLTGLERAN